MKCASFQGSDPTEIRLCSCFQPLERSPFSPSYSHLNTHNRFDLQIPIITQYPDVRQNHPLLLDQHFRTVIKVRVPEYHIGFDREYVYLRFRLITNAIIYPIVVKVQSSNNSSLKVKWPNPTSNSNCSPFKIHISKFQTLTQIYFKIIFH